MPLSVEAIPCLAGFGCTRTSTRMMLDALLDLLVRVPVRVQGSRGPNVLVPGVAGLQQLLVLVLLRLLVRIEVNVAAVRRYRYQYEYS
eukprot:scaffold164791_cov18-Prasinocladus_malaysianus.AAC.1